MSNRFGLRLALMASASLAAVAATPALAQTPTPVSFAISPDTPDPENEPSSIDDIIVTATKRETNLQDTAIAISVVNEEIMEQRHVQGLLDLFDGAVPSLRVSTFESRQSALTVGIRGIVPNDANQPAREQGVGVYLDGVYLGRQQGLNATMLDIERVEVLRGPQGTLFGRNTEGGAVQLITRRPSGEFGLRTAAGVSNYSGYNAEAHLDLPEFAGFSVKFDAALQYHDETTRNPMQGQKGWNYLNRRGARVSVLW